MTKFDQSKKGKNGILIYYGLWCTQQSEGWTSYQVEDPIKTDETCVFNLSYSQVRGFKRGCVGLAEKNINYNDSLV